MIRKLWIAAVIGGIWCSGWSLAGAARGCGLDGVPSVSVDGRLAVRMTTKPDRADLAKWAPFQFPGVFHQGVQLQFAENRAELQRSLPQQAFSKPWHWNFGDGTTMSGLQARHLYRRAGTYHISITAYYSSYGAWYQFDAALIHVR